jgi:hypothetical protein
MSGIGLGAAEHREKDILDVTAASRAHPMSKARDAAGAFPGSRSVSRGTCSCPGRFAGGQASRRRSRQAAAAVSTIA